MKLYSGDLSPKDSWDLLESNPAAHLIDVRTKAEWGYVGVPCALPKGKELTQIEWMSWPQMHVNQNFVRQVAETFSDRNTLLIFICRTGGRSQQAAIEMTKSGYFNCYNLTGGFEGELDTSGHRGVVNGWKAEGLPWMQS